jgi:hypothetical protein
MLRPSDESHADRVADQIIREVAREPTSSGRLDDDALNGLKVAATDILKVPLTGVKVHTGSFAQQLNHGLGARALTFGDNIFFGRGEYRPTTHAGAGLVAHELAHVAQQRAAGPRLQPKFRVAGLSFSFSPLGLETLAKLAVEKDVMDAIRWMNDSNESFSLRAVELVLSHRSDAEFRAGLVETVEAIRTKQKGTRLHLNTPFQMPGAWEPSAKLRNNTNNEFSDRGEPQRSDFSLNPQLLRKATAADKIKELFEPADESTPPVNIDCGTTVSLAVYYTLVERLGAAAFNRMFFDNEDLVRLVNPKALSGRFITKVALTGAGRAAVNELLPGDIVYFRNVPEYAECLKESKQSGVWAGEWATYMGNKEFVGFGLFSRFNYDVIEEKLHNAAVDACQPKYTGVQADVPGLRDRDGKAYAFRLDMKKLWSLMAANF